MTNETNNPDEPSSPASSRPQLHVVTQDEPQAATAKTSDKSLFSFVRTLLKNKTDTDLQTALREFVAETETGNPETTTDERLLIANILDLRDMRAVDVMIPRADIVAIDNTITQQELFSLFSERQFSRFPVYRETLDDVIGTIHIKDVLACMARGASIDIEGLVRDVPIVSPAIHVLDLLLEMKQTRRHMALVVDEYGGIDGLVTIGDIIQAIVGEIEDEHEVADEPQLIVSPDGAIMADGRVDIETFESRFGQFLTDDERQDVDTLGGLVFSIAGRVPSRGEVLSHESGLVFEILDADPRRVFRLRIRNLPKDSDE